MVNLLQLTCALETNAIVECQFKQSQAIQEKVATLFLLVGLSSLRNRSPID